jgi:hypothetical protein
MSFVIDDDAIRRMSETQATYTVTASNIVDMLAGGNAEAPAFSIAGTVTLDAPSMSLDAINKLNQIRQQIVESGMHLMSTDELDHEVAERKGRIE